MTKRYAASTSTDNHGGSARINPEDAPEVTRREVLAEAARQGLSLRRVGRMWQWRDGEVWRNGYQTNYLMLDWLRSAQ